MNETQNGTCVQCGTQGTILALKVEKSTQMAVDTGTVPV